MLASCFSPRWIEAAYGNRLESHDSRRYPPPLIKQTNGSYFPDPDDSPDLFLMDKNTFFFFIFLLACESKHKFGKIIDIPSISWMYIRALCNSGVQPGLAIILNGIRGTYNTIHPEVPGLPPHPPVATEISIPLDRLKLFLRVWFSLSINFASRILYYCMQ